MPPLYYKVWKWVLYRVDYKTGILKTSMGMIADAIQWEEFGVPRIPNKRTIMKILDWLHNEKMITRESNAKYTTITVINWETYNSICDDKVTQDAQPNAHYSRSTHKNLKEESKTISLTMPVVEPSTVDAPNQPEMGFKSQETEKTGSDIPTECYALYRRFNALVGPLSAQHGHVLKLQVLRKAGKLTDEQMFETVMNAGKKIRGAGDRDAYLLGVLKGAIDRPGENGKSNFNCPEHGSMARENWGGSIVYRCCKMVNGKKCPKHHKTGQTWTDQAQKWEPQSH